MAESSFSPRSAVQGGDASDQVAPVDRLLDILLADFGFLEARLASRLGSREVAAEVLQEIYLKLRSNPNIGDVRDARAYLYRMALNFAKNQWRSERRMVAMDEAMITGLADDAPGPEQTVVGWDEMNRLMELLQSLPSKRREIFLARWRDDKKLLEIAVEFGMHKRSIQKELDRAEQLLKRKLRRPHGKVQGRL